MYCWRRASASGGGGSGVGGWGLVAIGCGGGVAATPATGWPQSEQNLAPGASEAPQFAHAMGIALPQLKQNFAPWGLSVWQLAHFITQTSTLSNDNKTLLEHLYYAPRR